MSEPRNGSYFNTVHRNIRNGTHRLELAWMNYVHLECKNSLFRLFVELLVAQQTELRKGKSMFCPTIMKFARISGKRKIKPFGHTLVMENGSSHLKIQKKVVELNLTRKLNSEFHLFLLLPSPINTPHVENELRQNSESFSNREPKFESPGNDANTKINNTFQRRGITRVRTACHSDTVWFAETCFITAFNELALSPLKSIRSLQAVNRTGVGVFYWIWLIVRFSVCSKERAATIQVVKSTWKLAQKCRPSGARVLPQNEPARELEAYRFCHKRTVLVLHRDFLQDQCVVPGSTHQARPAHVFIDLHGAMCGLTNIFDSDFRKLGVLCRPRTWAHEHENSVMTRDALSSSFLTLCPKFLEKCRMSLLWFTTPCSSSAVPCHLLQGYLLQRLVRRRNVLPSINLILSDKTAQRTRWEMFLVASCLIMRTNFGLRNTKTIFALLIAQIAIWKRATVHCDQRSKC